MGVSVLLLKWWTERPRRKFQVFALDSSKQVVGSGCIHIFSMVCAMAFTSLDKAAADECAWYWVNIMLDTTLGVLICWALLRLTERTFGYSSGHYGKKSHSGIDWESSPDFGKWAAQIGVWCGIVCAMKLAVVLLMWAFASFWEHAATFSTQWIADRRARLFFVMVIT